MKIFPVLLAIIFGALMVTTIVAVVGFTLLHSNWFWGKDKVYADPWSWGHVPSKSWLHCYYSGSGDCSHIR
jgi:hypothetical protein